MAIRYISAVGACTLMLNAAGVAVEAAGVDKYDQGHTVGIAALSSATASFAREPVIMQETVLGGTIVALPPEEQRSGELWIGPPWRLVHRGA